MSEMSLLEQNVFAQTIWLHWLNNEEKLSKRAQYYLKQRCQN